MNVKNFSTPHLVIEFIREHGAMFVIEKYRLQRIARSTPLPEIKT